MNEVVIQGFVAVVVVDVVIVGAVVVLAVVFVAVIVVIVVAVAVAVAVVSGLFSSPFHSGNGHPVHPYYAPVVTCFFNRCSAFILCVGFFFL